MSKPACLLTLGSAAEISAGSGTELTLLLQQRLLILQQPGFAHMAHEIYKTSCDSFMNKIRNHAINKYWNAPDHLPRILRNEVSCVHGKNATQLRTVGGEAAMASRQITLTLQITPTLRLRAHHGKEISQTRRDSQRRRHNPECMAPS
jgi:hypothetical protein